MNAILYKRCTKCGELKLFADFCKDKQKIDGLYPQCSACRREAANKRYHINKQTILKKLRIAYAANPRKILDRGKAWQKRNPDKRKVIEKRYYAKHPDERRASISRSNKKHREQRREYERRRRHENPTGDKIKTAKRAAHRRSLPDTLTALDWQRCLDYFGSCCAACGRPQGLWHTIAADHWIPLASPDCPGTVPTNIVPLCHGTDGCNNSKCNRNANEWLTAKFGAAKAKKISQKIENYFASLHS